MRHSDDYSDDVLDAVRALEEHRPRMTEPELARVKRRAAGGASAPINRAPGGFMRSRLAITALLATGALMSSGGAALGVSALSTDLSASAAQYGTTTQQVAGTGAAGTGTGGAGNANTLGASDSGSSPAGTEDNGGVAAATATQPTATAQAARQVSASQANELPFTGYAAIPLLLVGLGLLAAGLVLRRTTRRMTQT
jgi:hypothetical protein